MVRAFTLKSNFVRLGFLRKGNIFLGVRATMQTSKLIWCSGCYSKNNVFLKLGLSGKKKQIFPGVLRERVFFLGVSAVTSQRKSVHEVRAAAQGRFFLKG